ncbi:MULTISPECIES: hypothetical protein [Rubritalea]|nr:hypothetical protein [Rubritalea squalenifaciens]
MDAEVISVFREEKEGVEGLQKTAKRTKASFQLLDDLGATQTKVYSQEGFDSYIIGIDGRVEAKLDGVKKVRPAAKKLVEELLKLSE